MRPLARAEIILTGDQVPRHLASVETIVLSGAEVDGGLFQNLLDGTKLGFGVVRITGNNNGLPSHTGSAQEKHVTVERRGRHLQGK